MTAATERTALFDDLMFVAHLSTTNAFHVHFAVYECVTHASGPNGYSAPFEYFREDSNSFETTPDRSAARIFVEGTIKADGCSDFQYGRDLHACGFEDMEKMHEMWRRIYREAHSIMDDPNWAQP
jgi:hypothetical protein